MQAFVLQSSKPRTKPKNAFSAHWEAVIFSLESDYLKDEGLFYIVIRCSRFLSILNLHLSSFNGCF